MGKTMSSHLLRYFNWILFIFAGNEDMHKSLDEFEIRPDATTVFFFLQHIGFQWEKRHHYVFSNVFDRIHLILAGKDDIHKSLNEFEIRRDPIMNYGVGCP